MDGRTYVIDERRYKFRDTEDIAKNEIIHHPLFGKLLAFYVDPASPDDASILRRHTGVATRNNTGGEIKNRIRLIRQALKLKPDYLPEDHPDKLPGLMVNKTCTKLIWEMREGYRWPESSSDTRNDSELPLDKDNHGVEALGRYFKGFIEQQAGSNRVSRQGRVKTSRRRA